MAGSGDGSGGEAWQSDKHENEPKSVARLYANFALLVQIFMRKGDVEVLDLPLTSKEIAELLDLSVASVELLWSEGRLRRTIHCSERPTGAIQFSSPYDVIEYWLVNCHGVNSLSATEADDWMLALAELHEDDTFIDREPEDQVLSLQNARRSFEDDLDPNVCGSISCAIILAVHRILRLVSLTDAATARSAYDFSVYSQGMFPGGQEIEILTEHSQV